MRKINRYGMGEMADLALLIAIAAIVPVRGKLECKTQHRNGEENSYKASSCVAGHVSAYPIENRTLDAVSRAIVTHKLSHI